MEGAATIDRRNQLLTEHRKEIVAKITDYSSPNAAELINEKRRRVSAEKEENCVEYNYIKDGQAR